MANVSKSVARNYADSAAFATVDAFKLRLASGLPLEVELQCKDRLKT